MAEKPDEEQYKLASATKYPAYYDVPAVSVDILTWNIWGSKTEQGFADIRGVLVPIVKQQLPTNCFSFLQEIGNGVEKTSRWGFDCLAASLEGGKKEAGVSTPRSGEAKRMIELGDILNEDKFKHYGVKDEFISRMYGRMVTMKCNIDESEYTGNLTMVSYHAPYKTEDKKAKIVEYFQSMCHLADKLEQTIIIGGDFNLPVLDWKDEVEKEFQDRVFVALYVATPRRWVRDKLIDTFAVVQPKSMRHRTVESQFGETRSVYPFPMAGHVGDYKTSLCDYPSCENQWFKYVHFSIEDVKAIEDKIKEKHKIDVQKNTEKIQLLIQRKTDELLRENDEDKKKQLNTDLNTLKQTKKEIRKKSKEEIEQWLSKPYSKPGITPPSPTPLWPNSPLDDVLDHDPVVSKVTVLLKQSPKNKSITPVKQVKKTIKK